jgi:hypothetical protein
VVDACPFPEFQHTSCTWTETTEVFIHPKHAAYPFVLAHEVGHQFDFQFMSEQDHNEYASVTGRPYHPEDFASDYGNCVLNPKKRPRWRRIEKLGHTEFLPMSQPTHRQLCRLLNRWAVERNA